MTECYRCGQEGHNRNECPDAWPLPADAPAESRASKLPGYGVPVPPRKPPSQIADYAVCSRAAREALGWAKTGSEEEDGTTVRTPFRERMQMPPRTDSELRAIAASQAAAARQQWRNSTPPAADLNGHARTATP